MVVSCRGAAETAVSTPFPTSFNGSIVTDGSSTVGPITEKVAAAFHQEYPHVEISVGISGTGGGFKKFCIGETAISNASRPIKADEAETCRGNGIEYIELPVAFDGLAVTVNPANSFVACLTTAELAQIWQPAAEATLTNWQQVRPTFPNQPLVLYGAGTDSGTYDYFTEAIVGTESQSRMDFFGSEDDYELVEGIAGDENALGFFGLSYYDENRDKLKLVAIDNGQGCVEPNTQTVARGLYQPLSRPLFIYLNRQQVEENPALNVFIDFYLAHAAQLVDDVGYIPLTDALYELVQVRYEERVTGSVFAEGGAMVGVSLTDLLMREK